MIVIFRAWSGVQTLALCEIGEDQPMRNRFLFTACAALCFHRVTVLPARRAGRHPDLAL